MRLQPSQSNPAPLQSGRSNLELQLESDGRAGLYPLLMAARGALLEGRYRVGAPFAAGRQVFVFDVTDEKTGEQAVLKQAAFDYRDPLAYGRREAAALRAPLLRDFEVQSACDTGHMSRPLALVRSGAIVPAVRGSAVLGCEEVFVIQEKLAARPLLEVSAQRWSALGEKRREAVAASVAREFVRFWEGLLARGWIYTDVNAGNLLLGEDERLFVVDAAGAVRAAPEFVSPGFSPAFATPRLWAASQAGRALPGDLSSVLPLLAKVLHFGLTQKTPFNGALSSLDDLAAFSSRCREAMGAMLRLDSEPHTLAAAREALARW